MSEKYSPGPWYWDKTLQGGSRLYSKQGIPVAWVTVVGDCDSRASDVECEDPDRRLIANAPALLDLVKRYLHRGTLPVVDEEADAIVAAIESDV